MLMRVLTDAASLGRAAAEDAARILCAAIRDSGGARLIAATGVSQFPFLENLVAAPGIDWARVELFHLDEYVGVPIEHRASFRRFLLDRLIAKTGITRHHLLDGTGDPAVVIARVGWELSRAPVDLAVVGIGENGHLAFNDPPADFAAAEPYLLVTLSDASRRQQVGEGWFATFAETPTTAISMSIRQILQSREIICVAPEARKARAVAVCFEGVITPLAPASILRTHGRATVYLDEDSAAELAHRPPTE